MYFAELIKNGHVDIFLKDISLIDAKYVTIIMELTKPLFQTYIEEEK
jgi:phosphopantetheine adenylyltransferase